jgi:hypothetical protein
VHQLSLDIYIDVIIFVSKCTLNQVLMFIYIFFFDVNMQACLAMLRIEHKHLS